MSSFKWGIIGTGRIAEDFLYSLQQVEDAQVIIVGGSSLERAKAFAEANNVPKYVGSYEEVAKDPEIDGIYVATLHHLHKEAALIAMNHKKHVLCEKPLAMNAQEVQEMIDCSKKNDVFFMEAMWTRYMPVIHKVKELVSEGTIGRVRGFQANFGFLAKSRSVERLTNKSFSAGSLLDIGIYACSLASMILGPEFPEKIEAIGELNEEGFDDQIGIVLGFKKGIATIHSSFVGTLSNDATILGENGRIVWSPIQCPNSYKIITESGTVEHTIDFPESDHKFNFKNSIALHYEAKYFQDAIKKGKKESDILTLDESLNIIKILDRVREIIGLTY